MEKIIASQVRSESTEQLKKLLVGYEEVVPKVRSKIGASHWKVQVGEMYLAAIKTELAARAALFSTPYEELARWPNFGKKSMRLLMEAMGRLDETPVKMPATSDIVSDLAAALRSVCPGHIVLAKYKDFVWRNSLDTACYSGTVPIPKEDEMSSPKTTVPTDKPKAVEDKKFKTEDEIALELIEEYEADEEADTPRS